MPSKWVDAYLVRSIFIKIPGKNTYKVAAPMISIKVNPYTMQGRILHFQVQLLRADYKIIN